MFVLLENKVKQNGVDDVCTPKSTHMSKGAYNACMHKTQLMHACTHTNTHTYMYTKREMHQSTHTCTSVHRRVS